MQVRQGDQPWYPEDTIESFVGHSSMGFLCPPAWWSWKSWKRSSLNLTSLWNRVWLTHYGTMAGTRDLFGFSELLCNSLGLRSLWLHKVESMSDFDLDFPNLDKNSGKWGGIVIVNQRVWGEYCLQMQNLEFATVLEVYISQYGGWNQPQSRTVHW